MSEALQRQQHGHDAQPFPSAHLHAEGRERLLRALELAHELHKGNACADSVLVLQRGAMQAPQGQPCGGLPPLAVLAPLEATLPPARKGCVTYTRGAAPPFAPICNAQ